LLTQISLKLIQISQAKKPIAYPLSVYKQKEKKERERKKKACLQVFANLWKSFFGA